MGKILFRLVAALLVAASFVCAQQPQQQKPLDIYFIDTEGGQATLFVPPSGQSMLVDTGFPGNQGAATPAEANAPGITRDADRITAVLKQANVTVLDYVVITHYHGDHAGNAAELASRIPIRHFVDHGPCPAWLRAAIANEYCAPLVNPVTVWCVWFDANATVRVAAPFL